MERTKFQRLLTTVKSELVAGVYDTVKNGHRDTMIERPTIHEFTNFEGNMFSKQLKPNQQTQMENLISSFARFWKGKPELPAGEILMNMIETLPEEKNKDIVNALICDEYAFTNLGSINYSHLGNFVNKVLKEDMKGVDSDLDSKAEEKNRASFYDEDEDEDLELMISAKENEIEENREEDEEYAIDDESDIRAYDNIGKAKASFLVKEDDVNLGNYEALTYEDESPYSQLKRKFQ